MEGEGASRAPRRVHLATLARGGDIEAQWELDNEPQCPPEAAYLWRYFLELDQTRPSNGMGICRLSRLEIRQWERDEAITLQPWERRAILAMDAAFATSTQPDNQPAEER